MEFKQYADIGQISLNHFYRTDKHDQFWNNRYPILSDEDNKTFNYWWIAHLIDVKIDAWLRTGDEHYLKDAILFYGENKKRNKGSLYHEYYDDMLWNALAALRLYEQTGEKEYLEDAIFVCDDIIETGWNDTCGGGFAWKRTQMYYKNTPVNAPQMILAMRLYRITSKSKYLDITLKTYHWFKEHLYDKETGFIEDGLNRNGDGEIDSQWRFTYNQGVFIGAALELYKQSGDSSYLEEAKRCGDIALKTLVREGVFFDDGDGGDVGLFQGILYRYLVLLYKETQGKHYKEFIHNSCSILISNKLSEGKLLADRKWKEENEPQVYLSDQLSAVMALEAAAII